MGEMVVRRQKLKQHHSVGTISRSGKRFGGKNYKGIHNHNHSRIMIIDTYCVEHLGVIRK